MLLVFLSSFLLVNKQKKGILAGSETSTNWIHATCWNSPDNGNPKATHLLGKMSAMSRHHAQKHNVAWEVIGQCLSYVLTIHFTV